VRSVTRPGAMRKSTLTLVLFCIYLLGIHLRLSIYGSDGQAIVPLYFCLFSGAMLALIFRDELSVAIQPLLALMSFLFLLPLFNLLLAPDTVSLQSYKSAIQFLVSILLSLVLAITLNKVPGYRLRKVIVFIWFFLVGMALLETLYLSSLFGQIKAVIYSSSGRGVYDNLDRDLALYGQVRATVLASEPSFLAFTMLSLCSIYYISASSEGVPKIKLRSALMFAVSYAICPSMTIVFFLTALSAWQFWPKTRNNKILFFGVATLAITAVQLINAFSPYLATTFALLIGEHGATGSFFGRITVGPIAGYRTLSEYPLFGIGIGNNDTALPILQQIWSDTGAYRLFPWFADLAARAPDLMSNGFWWQWIYLGLIGAPIFTVLVAKTLRSIGVMYPYRALFCAWIIWYVGSAFVDPMTWFVVSIFAFSAIQPPRPRLYSEVAK